ncbi:MAG: 4Fe-4S dicluster domain-containing protein [Planctomycetota bacterium]|jgi:phenylacetyl-CoA:acceptor oxidoreductase subunit 1
MARWAMIIDLRKCIGCDTCGMVCHQLNKVPPDFLWRKLIETRLAGNPEGKRLFLTMSCMHCERPSCLEVCPTGATHQRSDGIVDINLDLCVGCGACVVACPYQARSISGCDSISAETSGKDLDRIGVCTKCNFCRPYIDAGLAQGLQPGTDPEATPRCVRFCLAEALYFGDLDDPESEVSKLLIENNTVRLHDELATNPCTFYILP